MSKALQNGQIVRISLTAKEAGLVWNNADGWLDAGACEGGLDPEERAALHKLCDQIRDQIRPKTKGKSA